MPASIRDLPLELFREIMEEAVRQSSLRDVLRARLVSTTFSVEIMEAIFKTGALGERDKHIRYPLKRAPHSWVVRFLREEARQPRRESRSILARTICRAVEEILRVRGDESEDSRRAWMDAACECCATYLGNEISFQFPFGAPHLESTPHHSVHHALLVAAWTGDFALVQRLEKGRDALFPSEYYETALWSAARQGRMEIMQWLLEKGAETMARMKPWYDPWCPVTALTAACAGGHVEIVRYLLRQYEHTSETPWLSPEDLPETPPGLMIEELYWPFRSAARFNRVEVMKVLREYRGWSVLELSDILLEAWNAKAEAAVEYLLENGADPNVVLHPALRPNGGVQSASPIAWFRRNFGIAWMLLGKGADYNWPQPPKDHL